MICVYGQIVKLVKPTMVRIFSEGLWLDQIKSYFETEVHEVKDWQGNTSKSYTVTIPVNTLGALTFAHIDGTNEQYCVKIPHPKGDRKRPIKTWVHAGGITFDVTKQEKEKLRTFATNLITKGFKGDNFKKIQQIQRVFGKGEEK